MTASSSPQTSNCQAFLDGLLKPSGWSVTVALLVLVLVAGVVFGLSKAFVGSDMSGYLARNRIDHHLFVTTDVAQLATSGDKRPLVAILGASVTLSSFGTEEEIETALRDHSGVDAEVRTLSTSRQSILEHIAIIDAILTDRPISIIIGIGPSRLTRSRQELQDNVRHTELGFRSERVNAEAAYLGLEPADLTGIYFYDNRLFFLSRLKSLIANIVKERHNTRLIGEYLDRKMPAEDFDRHNKLVAARFADFDQKAALNLGLLEHYLRSIMARPNVKIVLAEHAINPIFVRDYLGAEFYAAYQARMREWAAKMGLPYWTLAVDAALTPDDYYDWAHIRSAEAQRRMRSLLAERLELAKP